MADKLPVLPGVIRVNFLKIPVDVVPPEAIPGAVEALLAEDRSHQVILLSLSDLLKARRNNDFRAWVLGASLVIPVSHAITRGLRFVTGVQAVRWMPFDFTVQLMAALEHRNRSLYLLGSRKKSLQTAERNLRHTFPGLRIVGRFNGGFRKGEESVVVTGIRKASPSLLLVGQGVPGEDRWIYRNLRRLGPGLKLWCGDLFDIFSERKHRPSKAIWDRGLEGIVRALKNPFTVLRVFPWLYYNYLLIFYRLFKRR